jgi:hypothetical protein
MVRAPQIHKEPSPLLASYVPILSRLRPAPVATPVIAVDDDPSTLARLAAIMSDRVQPCPNCGGDPHVCQAIGCDVDNAPLLLPQPSVSRSDDLDEAAALIDEPLARAESEVVGPGF